MALTVETAVTMLSGTMQALSLSPSLPLPSAVTNQMTRFVGGLPDWNYECERTLASLNILCKDEICRLCGIDFLVDRVSCLSQRRIPIRTLRQEQASIARMKGKRADEF